MPAADKDTCAGWVTAVRRRRKALPQRLGMGATTALIFTPLFGWTFSIAWVTGYFVVQLVDVLVFGPINRGADRMGPIRTLAGEIVMFLNAAAFGSLSVPLWLVGGPMGGVCAAILLASGCIYAVVNSPQSVRVLAITIAPQLLYLASTPFLMAAFGANSTFVTAVAVSIVVFAAYCLSTWKRMDEANIAESHARIDADRKRAEAEKAMASRAAFLAAVGHDLRTPISAILTGAAELERGAGGGPSRAQAALITDAGMMMKALLDDLLDHSKLDAGRMTVDETDFNLRGLLAQTFLFWRGAARAKGLTLRLEGAHEIPVAVRGDPMRLRQVLNNLISNAMKFTEAGSVTLRLRAWDEEPSAVALLIEVADTGPGMTEVQVKRLFTPFDQIADGVGARYGGTGLGLAISRDLAHLMGGRLTARSAPGRGANFTLSLTLPRGAEGNLPIITGLADDSRGDIARVLAARTTASGAPLSPKAEPVVEPLEPVALTMAEPETEASDDEGRPLRVLVVDDHDINRRAVELILTPLGCEIATAADGLVALRLCETEAFDVIFMDVRMPELDGRETTRRLRAGDGPNAHVPVIAVTADTAPEDIAACMAAGMTYFVSKPLTPPMLLGALSHVLSEGDAAAESAAA